MDIKKDIQGHTRNQGLTLGIQKGQSSTSSSGMESFGISLGKKSERLATALYLVTSFLSDTEPLKGRLRIISLDLVRDASGVRYGSISIETGTFESLRANISETLALLELAFIAGLISEMNFSILKREYASLRDAVEIKKASRESRSDTILGDTFFANSPTVLGTPLRGRSGNLNTEFFTNRRDEELTANKDKGHLIGHEDAVMSDKMKSHAPDLSRTHKSRGEDSKGQLIDSADSATTTMSITQEARRTRILKLIKDNREVTIKDIATYFPELSEKTIQRELVSLVEKGVLKKSGERRWSRYSIA
ncbi:MAG: DeoR family transcriptional regulator [Minisyncoccota bacterium]